MTIDTKERLIAAGVELMLGGGFSATGIKDIVQRAGVPKGSFYYYFESKDAYTVEVVDRYAGDGGTARTALIADRAVPPLIRLRRSFERYRQHYIDREFADGCLLGNLSVDIAERNDIVRSRLQAAFRAWEHDLAGVLREAATDGTLPAGLDPARTAAFLLNAWEGALVRMKAEQGGAPLDDFLVFFDRLLPAAPQNANSRSHAET